MNRSTISMFLQAAFDMPDYTPTSEEDANKRVPPGWDWKKAQRVGTEDGVPGPRPITGYAKVDEFTAALQQQGAVFYTGTKWPFTDNTGTKAIGLPKLELFHSAKSLAYTLMHEGSHWAGSYGQHPRQFRERPYPLEEVIAESTAATLLAEWGITDDNIATINRAYVANWLSADPDPIPPLLRALLGETRKPTTIREKYTVDYVARQVEQRYNDVQAIIKGA